MGREGREGRKEKVKGRLPPPCCFLERGSRREKWRRKA
jgi:hypothetical protein